MATTVTFTNLSKADKLSQAAWTLTTTETGDAIELPIGDRAVQLTGTFNGSTVVVEGSIDGTNYATLTDGLGNNLSFTAAGLKQIAELVRYIRPRVSSGSATSVVITLLARRGF